MNSAPMPPPPVPPPTSRPHAGMSSGRRVLLGRIVDLGRLEAVRTLTDPPDEEITDVSDDIGVLLLRDSTIAAFRLTSGELVWERTPDAPCRQLLLAGARVYAGCGDKLLSYSVKNGDQKVVDDGPHAMNPLIAGPVVVSPRDNGQINLYDSVGDKPLASKVLPELAGAFHRYVLANPGSGGVCVLGLVAISAKHFTYRAGCYDDMLTLQWTRSLSMKVPRDSIYDVRQLGPYFLVLDDQYSVLDPARPPGPGQGLVLRWRDGEVTRFKDKTFGTLENVQGERLSSDVGVFSRTRDLANEHEDIPLRQAKVAGDGRRAFALIVNGATALAGVDRATGREIFLVPVLLGGSWKLEIADGMPVVRTRFADRWVVTIHEPTTGSVLYRDTRPLARAP